MAKLAYAERTTGINASMIFRRSVVVYRRLRWVGNRTLQASIAHRLMAPSRLTCIHPCAAYRVRRYYCGGINRLLAEDLVAPCPDGAFIVRWSSQVGRLAITYKLDGKICNAFIYMHGAKGCTDKANPQPDDFKPNVPALIADRDDLFRFSVLDVLRRLEHDDADAAQALILALERSVSNVSLGSGTGSSINLHVNHRGSGRGTVRSTATQPLHISVAGHSVTAGTAQASPITASPRTEQVPSPAFTTASGVPSPVRTSAPTTPSAPVGRRESMEAIYGTLQTKYTPLQL